jgi:hypothetical protein
MTSTLSGVKRAVALAAVLCVAAASAMAAPDEHRGGQRDGQRGRDHAPRAEGSHSPSPRGEGTHTPAPHARGGSPAAHHWYDGAHGHARYYPKPGWSVRILPPLASTVFWGGVGYGFYDGVWYSPGSRGYVVVRPPFGIVVADLPAFRTVVTVGGVPYLYVDGAYYLQRPEGGYEVVPPPVANDSAAAASAQGVSGNVSGNVVSTAPDGSRLFVYPRQNQSAAQQASDEYECHRWAVSQSGFDPTAAAMSTPSGPPAKRADYQRAQAACLDGRGYTVR